jgi:hypothetical protein
MERLGLKFGNNASLIRKHLNNDAKEEVHRLANISVM